MLFKKPLKEKEESFEEVRYIDEALITIMISTWHQFFISTRQRKEPIIYKLVLYLFEISKWLIIITPVLWW